ncbi:hypothetical protein Tco_0611544 [Tanacetum coccineum]
MRISSAGDFLGTTPSYTLISNPILRYLRLFAVGRKSEIYVELDDTWAWEAMGPERQPIAAAGAPVWICQILQEISQKRTRERMSDQEAKEIMPQPSTVNCSSTTVSQNPRSNPTPAFYKFKG